MAIRMSKIMDLRDVPRLQRTEDILRAFDALRADDTLVLIHEQDPRPVLRDLQAARPGAFNWSVLSEGPAGARVELCRVDPEGAWTVTGYLEWDHRRLDALAKEALGCVRRGQFPSADEHFLEFYWGLGRHMEMEEQVLMPFYQDAIDLDQDPMVLAMRNEHIQIRRELVSDLKAALESRDAKVYEDCHYRLFSALSSHHLAEERILYPCTDAILGSAEDREELVRLMQAL